MLKTLRFSVRLPSFLLCTLSYYVVLFCKQTCKKLSSKLLLYFPFTGLISAIYGPVIYTAPHVMLLMRATAITRASGNGLGPGNRNFFGPCEMASSRQASAIWGPKKSKPSAKCCGWGKGTSWYARNFLRF
jgi:hypothetical protein